MLYWPLIRGLDFDVIGCSIFNSVSLISLPEMIKDKILIQIINRYESFSLNDDNQHLP